MTESSLSSAASMCASVGLFVATALASQAVQRAMKKEVKDESVDSPLHYKWGQRGRMSHDSLVDFANTNGNDSAQQRADGEAIHNGSHDFQPKNRNWKHFDCHEQDDAIDQDTEDESSSSDEAFLWTRKRRGSISSRNSSPPEKQDTWSSIKPLRAFKRFGSSIISDVSGDPGQVYAGDEADAVMTPRSRARSLHRYSSAPLTSSTGEPQVQNRAARAQYNARIMPNKVVLLRHGQSMGNIDERLYSTTPDNAMRITKLGFEQARKAGEILKEQVLASGESIHFIVSPYVRTVETFHGVVSAWCDPAEFNHIQDREKRLKAWYERLMELGLTWHEDPRIREQDFGNYQDPESIRKNKKERHRFGVFFYRFPYGESASDVFDRVSTFLDSLWRSFDLNRSRNYVLITHGISIRVLLARYFRYTIQQFGMLANPANCEMIILGHDGKGRLELDGRCELELGENAQGETHVVGHKCHQRLRTVPSHFVQKVKIRVSYDDDVDEDDEDDI